MTNRFHIPVVVTTSDDVTKEEVIQSVEAMLSNLEETDHMYRTFVEDESIETSEADRLFQLLERINDDDIAAAFATNEPIVAESNDDDKS